MNFRENMSRSKEVLYGPGTIAQHAEYGMAGTRTPGEVADGLRGSPGKEASRDAPSPSLLDQYIEQGREREAPQREPEREDRHIERE